MYKHPYPYCCCCCCFLLHRYFSFFFFAAVLSYHISDFWFVSLENFSATLYSCSLEKIFLRLRCSLCLSFAYRLSFSLSFKVFVCAILHENSFPFFSILCFYCSSGTLECFSLSLLFSFPSLSLSPSLLSSPLPTLRLFALSEFFCLLFCFLLSLAPSLIHTESLTCYFTFPDGLFFSCLRWFHIGKDRAYTAAQRSSVFCYLFSWPLFVYGTRPFVHGLECILLLLLVYAYLSVEWKRFHSFVSHSKHSSEQMDVLWIGVLCGISCGMRSSFFLFTLLIFFRIWILFRYSIEYGMMERYDPLFLNFGSYVEFVFVTLFRCFHKLLLHISMLTWLFLCLFDFFLFFFFFTHSLSWCY